MNLFESLQMFYETKSFNVLYRKVGIACIKDVISNDKMIADYPSKLGGCICFSRNKQYNNKYRPHGITFIFNRDKLSNNYKIRPFMNKESIKLKHNEFEERIYKDIIDLHKYVIQIDISILNRNKLALEKSGFKTISEVKELLLATGYNENQIIL